MFKIFKTRQATAAARISSRRAKSRLAREALVVSGSSQASHLDVGKLWSNPLNVSTSTAKTELCDTLVTLLISRIQCQLWKTEQMWQTAETTAWIPVLLSLTMVLSLEESEHIFKGHVRW